ACRLRAACTCDLRMHGFAAFAGLRPAATAAVKVLAAGPAATAGHNQPFVETRVLSAVADVGGPAPAGAARSVGVTALPNRAARASAVITSGGGAALTLWARRPAPAYEDA